MRHAVLLRLATSRGALLRAGSDGHLSEHRAGQSVPSAKKPMVSARRFWPPDQDICRVIRSHDLSLPPHCIPVEQQADADQVRSSTNG